jgi:hypothetical protein
LSLDDTEAEPRLSDTFCDSISAKSHSQMEIEIDDASPQFDYVLVGGNATVDHSLWVNGFNKTIGELLLV